MGNKQTVFTEEQLDAYQVGTVYYAGGGGGGGGGGGHVSERDIHSKQQFTTRFKTMDSMGTGFISVSMIIHLCHNILLLMYLLLNTVRKCGKCRVESIQLLNSICYYLCLYMYMYN